ncbi:MAG TPA: hypothetical protein VF476_01080 [Chitinophagaceae bacterium]
MNQTKLSNEAVFSILKAIHHTNAAHFYIGRVMTESQVKMNAKKFLKGLESKIYSVLIDLRLRISEPETKEIMNQELADPLAVDVVLDTYLCLTHENRANFEEYGSFLVDTQKAAELRKAQGYSDHFDERVGQPKEALKQYISECKRQLKIMEQQMEIIERIENQSLQTA